ncbi:MAG: hypothetical protein HKL80_08875 [Acidimicrobiales bacterium]|nr:hypothetical protein [Acidimicrobiales bacterium]
MSVTSDRDLLDAVLVIKAEMLAFNLAATCTRVDLSLLSLGVVLEF